MNLINCSRNCKHQQDGCCQLDSIAAIAGTAFVPDCYYYQPHGDEQPQASYNTADESQKNMPSG